MSHTGLPFKLDVSVIPEGEGGALWRRQTEGETPPKVFVPPLEGERNLTNPTEQQQLAVYAVLLQVQPLTKEQYIVIRTSLPTEGGPTDLPVPLLKFPLGLNGGLNGLNGLRGAPCSPATV